MPVFRSASSCLAAVTILTSMIVAYLVHGTILTSVNVVDLRKFGGTTFEDLANFEIWRICTAQLIHSKFPHMLFNALCLYLLGNALEQQLGGIAILTIWLIAGGIATVVSPILVMPPWNVGTGASQACFALAGCALVCASTSPIDRKTLIILSLVTVLPGLVLDLTYVGYPKLGHTVGLVLGACFGLYYARRTPQKKPITPLSAKQTET